MERSDLFLEDVVILVIEDNADNLLVITDLLRMMGIRTIYSHTTGMQGIAFAETLPRVDVMLLDLQLPDEDGYAVLQHIRAHPTLQKTRVIATTANVLPHDEQQARDSGFDGFIGKPFHPVRFPSQIQAVLAGRSVWQTR
jgi:two-component system cell cycle response regulator DivK